MYLGHGAILASNLLFLTATLLLRQAGAIGGNGLLVLWLASLVAGLSIFVFRSDAINAKASTKETLLDYLALFIWSCSYVGIYGISIVLPKSITIPHLMLAESAAPFIALAFFKDVRNEWSFPIDVFRLIGGFALIVFMAWIAWSQSSSTGIATDWSLFALISALYTVSQAMARYISKRRAAFWGPPRMSLMVVLLLGVLIFGFLPDNYKYANFSYQFVALILIAGMMMPLNRGCFLFGLRKTPATQAALLINMTLPLAMIFHFIESDQMSFTGMLHLAIYIFVALALAFIKPKTNKPELPRSNAAPQPVYSTISCTVKASSANSTSP